MKNKNVSDFNPHDLPIVSAEHYGPGVYFLFFDKQIVYIGQSKFAMRRVVDHLGQKKIQFDGYAILNIDESELSATENHLIYKFKPLYNKTWVNSPYRTNIGPGEVVRCTITLPEAIDKILVKQATKKLMKPATYFSSLLREIAETNK